MPGARKTLRWPVALFACAVAAAGCQLFVDLDRLEDQSCPPDYKACNEQCVSEFDTATGCGDFGCNPCAPLHAEAICDNRNHCSFTKCIEPWDDCEDEPGCETDLLHTPMHCGACRRACLDQPHATAGCSEGKCAIGKCEDGWEDCDDDPLNGCEHPIWTDLECVYCKIPCPEGTSCEKGICGMPGSDGGAG
jgi:hypothetical protein